MSAFASEIEASSACSCKSGSEIYQIIYALRPIAHEYVNGILMA